MAVRRTERRDLEPIRSIVAATGVFNEEEIGIAVELLEVYLNDPQQKDYEIYTSVDEAGTVTGYICFGPTPATAATYDMYWIAVDPTVQTAGIGSELLRFTEELLKGRGGRLIVAETSSTVKYDKTRAFYERKGFEKFAQIREYYRPGDDLVIYGKYL